MDNKKPLTKEAVKLALDLLIVTNNQATTLEIKLHLQNLEYFAKQENVHDFMEEIFAENVGKYNRSLNPGGGPAYNIYTAVSDWEATVAAKTVAANTPPAEVSHINTSFKGSVIDAAIDAAIEAQNAKTPLHKFHDRIRDSKFVPGVGIVAEYTPRTGELKTINDLNGGDPTNDTVVNQQANDTVVNQPVDSSDLRAPLNIFYTADQFEDYKLRDLNYNPKNWICHQRYNDQTEIHEYSHKVTRDQARSRFASMNHIKSAEVRCSMAGNLTLSEA